MINNSVHKARILIIDDSSMESEVFSEILKEAGFDTRILNDPSLALETTKDYIPHLVLLDVMMPKCNGIEVLRICRSMQATKDIPIIIITSTIDKEMIRKAVELGISGYIVKDKNLNIVRESILQEITRLL